MAIKIALDAGHGFNTPGKRTPDGEREWSFNDAVVRAAIARLGAYHGVEVLRVDDPTGKEDISLAARTSRANAWKADVYVSVHHNALSGNWHPGGGAETFTFPTATKAVRDIAAAVHSRIVDAMGVANRGLKTANFQVLRETKMPAILTEGGFMDSSKDIVVMRNPARLKAQGEAIAEGLAAHFGLKAKVIAEVKPAAIVKNPKEAVKLAYEKDAQPSKSLAEEFKEAMAKGITDGTYPHRPATREEVAVMVLRGMNK